jgi:uncharacterized protein YuzE
MAKIEYDPVADAAYIYIKPNTKYDISEDYGNFIFDFNTENVLMGVEILYVSELFHATPEYLTEHHDFIISFSDDDIVKIELIGYSYIEFNKDKIIKFTKIE